MRTSPSTQAQDMEQVFPWVGLDVSSHAMPVSGSDRLSPWAATWLPVRTDTWRVYIAPAQ